MNAIFLGLTLVVSAPALKGPVKGEAPPIEGTWQLVEWLQLGKPVGFWEGMTVEFRPDGKRICREGPDSFDERAYKLIAKTDPPAIDLIRPSGDPEPTVYPCIFKIDGASLIISVGEPGRERPKIFESDKGGVLMVMKYKRVKK
jgi:uncharacterized protein (TIGR03067 family)